MIIVSPGSLDDIGAAIVNAVVSAGDHRGRAFVSPTIDPELLRRAAQAALVAVTGDAVWVLGTPPLEIEADERVPFIKRIYPTR